MSSESNHQFIGPLKPGQRPPPPMPKNSRSSDDNWSILSLLDPHYSTSSSSAVATSNAGKIGKIKKPKMHLRAAGGAVWEDPSLAEWDPEDYRVFVGDLGNDVTDELLEATFKTYPTFVKAKVVRDKRANKSKGFGFVSFKDAQDYARAIKEWDGKYLGCRPIKMRKSNWKDRSLELRKNKMPEASDELDPLLKPQT